MNYKLYNFSVDTIIDYELIYDIILSNDLFVEIYYLNDVIYLEFGSFIYSITVFSDNYSNTLLYDAINIWLNDVKNCKFFDELNNGEVLTLENKYDNIVNTLSEHFKTEP